VFKLSYTINAEGKYVCDADGWVGSKSGFYKHKKMHDEETTVEVSETQAAGDEPFPSRTTPESPVAPVSSGWQDWEFEIDDTATVTIPEPLKIIFSTPEVREGNKKLTAKQQKNVDDRNLLLLKAGLGGIDQVLTQYGRVVRLEPEFEVKHSDSDKTLVASAQHAWMQEKGIDPSMYLGTGVVALGLTGWYIGQPLLMIQKSKKRKLLKAGSFVYRMLAKVPYLGRRFKPKPSQGRFQEVDEDDS
jgi:hypothetical protein